MDLKEDLLRALDRREFWLAYQPTINLENNAIAGCEALLRWNHPEHGAISPGVFVPAAEACGVITRIGDWVLEQACADAAAWPSHISLAVNFSVLQFKSRSLADQVGAVVANAGIAPSRLEVEVTESVLIDDSDSVIETLGQLHALGVRVALDDFGTGYSSLSYLQRFAFDRIKIDRCFVGTLSKQETSSRAIIRAVARLGANLGMQTTAEGVETAAQLEIVRSEGCTDAQGYFFRPPMPRAEFAALLNSDAEAATQRTWSKTHKVHTGHRPKSVEDEEQRLDMLYGYDILDTPNEEPFDRITRMAKWALKVPMAMVSLVDRDRQWFKSRLGVEHEEMPRNISFCTHAISSDHPLCVPDTLQDARFRQSPMVTGPQKIRSYLGVPLRISTGEKIGTLCVNDVVPRDFTPGQIEFLRDLAHTVVDELELRRLAKIDGLTGALTERAFQAAASATFRQAKQSGRLPACVTLTVKNLEKINEMYGRSAGDQILSELAELCRESAAPADLIGRVQGGEFAVLLSDTTPLATHHFAKSLRRRIRAKLFRYSTHVIGVSTNVGVAYPNGEEIAFNRVFAKASRRVPVRRRAKTGAEEHALVEKRHCERPTP